MEDSSSTVREKILATLLTIEQTKDVDNRVILIRELFEYMMTIPTFLREHETVRLASMEKSKAFRDDPMARPLLPVLNRYDRYIQNIISIKRPTRIERPTSPPPRPRKRVKTSPPVLRRSTRLGLKTDVPNMPNMPSMPSVGDKIVYEGYTTPGEAYEYDVTDMVWVGYNENGSSHWIIPAHVTGVCLNEK